MRDGGGSNVRRRSPRRATGRQHRVHGLNLSHRAPRGGEIACGDAAPPSGPSCLIDGHLRELDDADVQGGRSCVEPQELGDRHRALATDARTTRGDNAEDPPST